MFGASNFVANVIWQKTYTRENRTDISIRHDNVIVYAVDKTRWKKARNLLPPSEEQRSRYSNPRGHSTSAWLEGLCGDARRPRCLAAAPLESRSAGSYGADGGGMEASDAGPSTYPPKPGGGESGGISLALRRAAHAGGSSTAATCAIGMLRAEDEPLDAVRERRVMIDMSANAPWGV